MIGHQQVWFELHTPYACNCKVLRVMPKWLDSTRHQARARCTWMGSFSAPSLEVEYINLWNTPFADHLAEEDIHFREVQYQ